MTTTALPDASSRPDDRVTLLGRRSGAVLVLVILMFLVGLGGTAQAAQPAAATSPATSPATTVAPAAKQLVYSNLVRDGSFESPNAWTRTAGTNFVEWRTGQVSPSSTARSGNRYGATNASATNGSIYQDRSYATVPGQALCASAYVRTQAGATGAGGTFALWLIGGSKNENATFSFANLGHTWGQLRTCVQATTNHSVLRIQLYPKVNGPTVDIDDVDVHNSLAYDAGFEGPSYWHRSASTNFVEWRSGQVSRTSTARSGVRYGATNTSIANGSIWQDLSTATALGDTVCASASVRTQAGATGAAGTFAVRLMGGSTTDTGFANFANLGNGWVRYTTCVEATTSHTVVRIQLYPRTNGPTVDVDDVDVHASRVPDGSFEGAGGWATTGSTNYVNYRTGINTNQRALSGTGYGATNTSTADGSVYRDIAISTVPGQTFCSSAYVRTQAGETHAGGTFAVWLIGGSYNENGSVGFSNLTNGWTLVQTCVQATTNHSTLRVQLYPRAGGPTVDIDAVDVH